MLHVDDEPEFAELVSIYLERDGEALEVVTETSVEHGGDGVRVTVGVLPDGFYVEDGGPGIPEADRDRIFEAGYSTKAIDGGFGMASVRQLVLAHGWEITAAEGAAGGARFEITDADIEPEGGVALPADE